MRRVVSVLALGVVLAGGSAIAGEPPLQISYPTDGSLDCAGLNAEIARMDGIMGVSNDEIAGAQGSARAADIGASAAINGALYSGALGRAPGLGLLGNAMASGAKSRAAAKEAEAKERIRTAETRRAMLMGIYQGRNCGAPAAPVQAAEPAAAAPAAPPAEPAP
ncbi:MAG TPA: hypothetical protein VF122_05540 [Caulobacteraceae bacterium]